MCYVCDGFDSDRERQERGGRREQMDQITVGDFWNAIEGDRPVRWLTQWTVLVARNWTAARHFCRDYLIRLQDPHLIVIVPGDPRAESRLRGLRDFTVVRADGAMADHRVEQYLTHLARTRGDFQVNIQLRTGGYMDSSEAALAMLRQMAGTGVHAPYPGRQEPDPERRVEAAGERERVRRARRPLETVPTVETEEETAWVSPHQWASTLPRSPHWDNQRQVLRVPTMDLDVTLEYRPDELEEDIRYV